MMQKRFALWFAVSLCLSLIGFFGFAFGMWRSIFAPWIVSQESIVYSVSAVCSLFWVFVQIGALIAYGKRALWLLIGAPFALAGPTFIAMIVIRCLVNSGNCP